MSSRCAEFRSRLRSGEKTVGTFQKTPSSIVSEVLALSDLDVIVIDAEHHPFGRLEIDACIGVLRNADFPSLVRIGDDSPREIRNALDSGATGILVPHVTTGEQAAAIVKAAHFGEGGRGFAGSTRASDYTSKTMPNHLADSANETTIVVQIEDIAALDNVAEIAAVQGVDAVFIGRIDLAVAMGTSPMDDRVVNTVRKICVDARKAGATVGMFTPDMSEIPMWDDLEVSLYLLNSEQGMILAGANSLATEIR